MSKLQANLKEYTDEECAEMGIRAYELRQQGRYEESDAAIADVPIIPGMAQQLKDEMGIEALIATGMNLSDAVKRYGMEWLNE